MLFYLTCIFNLTLFLPLFPISHSFVLKFLLTRINEISCCCYYYPLLAGEMPPSIRHWCEQGDGLSMYSWFAHDGRHFGLQEIMDKYYTLSTDFVKRQGGHHGGDWTARVTVKPRVRIYIFTQMCCFKKSFYCYRPHPKDGGR